MSYSNLIGDEVYWGSPCHEEFHTIVDVCGAGSNVEIHLKRHGKVTPVIISKQDIDKYIKEEYIEFVNDSKVQVLKSCAYQQSEWAAYQQSVWGESF